MQTRIKMPRRKRGIRTSRDPSTNPANSDNGPTSSPGKHGKRQNWQKNHSEINNRKTGILPRKHPVVHRIHPIRRDSILGLNPRHTMQRSSPGNRRHIRHVSTNEHIILYKKQKQYEKISDIERRSIRTKHNTRFSIQHRYINNVQLVHWNPRKTGMVLKIRNAFLLQRKRWNRSRYGKQRTVFRLPRGLLLQHNRKLPNRELRPPRAGLHVLHRRINNPS